MMDLTRGIVLSFAAVVFAACGRGSAQSADGLQSDAALAASVQSGLPVRTSGSVDADIAACRATQVRPAATLRRQAQADVQLQLAAEAQAAGDARGAREALRRAARLDSRSDGIAYRLAQADEAVGDSAAAVREYCRYLTLAPTAADSAVARRRLVALASYAATAAPATQLARGGSSRATRSGTAYLRQQRIQQAARGAEPAGGATVASAANGSIAEPSSPPPVDPPGADTPRPDVTNGARMPAGGGVYDPSPAPRPTPPRPTVPSTGSTARQVMIGAAVGAVLGTVADRSVRGAVIGAATGGVLGSIVGSRARPPRLRTTF